MAVASPQTCDDVWALCTFDALHWPYGRDTARAYLKALSPEALGRYQTVVQPLDLMLPPLLCIWLCAAAARWAVTGAVRSLGVLAVLYAAVDYLENGLIYVMLRQPGGEFPGALAMAASGLTTLKWLALAGFVVMLATRLDRDGGR